MHPSRIFDKPTGVHDSLPLLQVVGVLPNYEEAAAYEGRLDILNAVGDCRVELLENNLPPGATAMVDNATQEVVIRWPPYTPPETEKPGIINWDFQLETLEGWNDLRGNSWRCENSIVLGTNWATDGDYVGVMRGAGRAGHGALALGPGAFEQGQQ